MKKLLSVLFIFIYFHQNLLAQAPKKPTSSEIYEAISKLNFLGSVLYIAAHPDDENTRLISYFANDVKARTAYLSITRGDGGQNLIGAELRELLGVIRTQELIAARSIDGGEQFFTRANDFGYSNHPDETLEIWNKAQVLNDIVAVIRSFKPDIIINRFNATTPGTTHGHHTSSAMLSVEAFNLAFDNLFKTHLKVDEIWKPKRLFFNTSWWFYGSEDNFNKADKTNLLDVEVGTFYQNLGLSNGEIAALSRSQHQSQGFGSTGSRGKQTEYLEFLKGDFPKNNNVFDGIDTTWNRVVNGDKIGKLIEKVLNEYNFKNPSASIPDLLKAYQLIQQLNDEHWKKIKSKEIIDVIYACLGLYFEAVSEASVATINDKNTFNIEAVNRSNISVFLKSIAIEALNYQNNINVNLQKNIPYQTSIKHEIASNIKFTSPYWLTKKGSVGMYAVDNPEYIGLPETPHEIITTFTLVINGVELPINKEIIFKQNDPVKGEVYKPFEILPKVAATFNEKIIVFTNEEPQKVSLKVKAIKENLTGKLSLCYPEDWKVIPENIDFKFSQRGEEQTFLFEVYPPKNQSEGFISPIIDIDRTLFTNQLVEIEYNHIPFQSVIMSSEAKVVRLNVAKKGQLVGYIQGAGDEIPKSLRQIGYTVVQLQDEDITPEKLSNFDAIVLGIRAYNTNENSKFYQKYLHQFVENGGTLIVQYNTNFRLKVDEVAPFSLTLSRDRVTNENSEVRFINPSHPLLNFPNKITLADFDGWEQERGLYFPNKWDEHFETIIGMNDKNEPTSNGSILIAKFGKGNFIYTGLSFFRQLPAGVSGAYKLFANMLSVGKATPTTEIKN